MKDLFRAFFFKLRKDLTFRITLIVGAGLAVLLMVIFLLIEKFVPDIKGQICTGQTMYLVSFAPTSNFGLAIPINLVTFTVLEFTHGVIRNKIVAGNSKFKIYLGLFLSGLVFALSLLLVYAGLCTLLGTICGGFDPNGFALSGLSASGIGKVSPEFLGKTLLVAIVVYISITAFTIFVSTLLRNVGPSIPLIMVPLMFLAIAGPILITVNPDIAMTLNYLSPLQVLINPSFANNGSGIPQLVISNEALVATIVSNLLYTGLFFGFGSLIFVKRDVK